MDNKLLIGKINIFLENEMIQVINDELNLTFTTTATLAQVEKAFQSNIKPIAFNEQSFVGYTQIRSIGYSMNNENKIIYKVVLSKPEEVVEAITPADKKAVAYAIKHMPDEEALTCVDAFPDYAVGNPYKVNDRFKFKGNLFKVVQAHTSQADWTPDTTKSLYVQIANPAIEYPEFVQPAGAHDAYKNGDKVTYNGKKYVSTIDSNVWAPDAYPQGWKEVQ